MVNRTSDRKEPPDRSRTRRAPSLPVTYIWWKQWLVNIWWQRSASLWLRKVPWSGGRQVNSSPLLHHFNCPSITSWGPVLKGPVEIGPVELSTESGFLAWLFKDMQCHMLWVEAVNQMQPVCEYPINFTQFCFEGPNWWRRSNLTLIGTSPLIQASINRGGTWLRHQRLHSTFII